MNGRKLSNENLCLVGEAGAEIVHPPAYRSPLCSHAPVLTESVAPANPPRHRATPVILFPNGDVSAAAVVNTVSLPPTPSVAPALFVRGCPFGLAALPPRLSALVSLLRGIANVDVGATVRANAKLKGWLGHHG